MSKLDTAPELDRSELDSYYGCLTTEPYGPNHLACVLDGRTWAIQMDRSTAERLDLPTLRLYRRSRATVLVAPGDCHIGAIDQEKLQRRKVLVVSCGRLLLPDRVGSSKQHDWLVPLPIEHRGKLCSLSDAVTAILKIGENQ